MRFPSVHTNFRTCSLSSKTDKKIGKKFYLLDLFLLQHEYYLGGYRKDIFSTFGMFSHYWDVFALEDESTAAHRGGVFLISGWDNLPKYINKFSTFRFAFTTHWAAVAAYCIGVGC